MKIGKFNITREKKDKIDLEKTKCNCGREFDSIEIKRPETFKILEIYGTCKKCKTTEEMMYYEAMDLLTGLVKEMITNLREKKVNYHTASYNVRGE